MNQKPKKEHGWADLTPEAFAKVEAGGFVKFKDHTGEQIMKVYYRDKKRRRIFFRSKKGELLKNAGNA